MTIIQIGERWINLDRANCIVRTRNRDPYSIQVNFGGDVPRSEIFYGDEAVALAAMLDRMAGPNRFPIPK